MSLKKKNNREEQDLCLWLAKTHQVEEMERFKKVKMIHSHHRNNKIYRVLHLRRVQRAPWVILHYRHQKMQKRCRVKVRNRKSKKLWLVDLNFKKPRVITLRKLLSWIKVRLMYHKIKKKNLKLQLNQKQKAKERKKLQLLLQLPELTK